MCVGGVLHFEDFGENISPKTGISQEERGGFLRYMGGDPQSFMGGDPQRCMQKIRSEFPTQTIGTHLSSFMCRSRVGTH